ncbi:TNT domain-containing protein [Streptomyces sp. NPDC001262]|uniref:TNT domain-containing protein n=1 Tax=Streptomyces sp. NPDC001262 TaxID=3364552 RepID=UPI0036C63CE2
MKGSVWISTATCAALFGGMALAGPAQAASAAPAPECAVADHGDWSLGPDKLPVTAPVGPLVTDYDKLGGADSAKDFLDAWKNDNWDWRYPGNDGFAGTPNRVTVTYDSHHEVYVDRFGAATGTFVSPAAKSAPASYAQRSIPPSNLHTYRNDDGTYGATCNYHVYKLLPGKSFTGLQGSIAAWFGQPGGGTQIKLDKPVRDLIAAKVLAEVTPGRKGKAPRHVARPALHATDRSTLRAELRRAGVPDASYRIDGFHEPRLPATEYYALRQIAGRWVVALTERGKEQVVARYADEAPACARLYDELAGHLG